LTVADIKQAFLDNLFYQLNRGPKLATKHDLYTALAVTVRDRVFHLSVHTIENPALAEVLGYIAGGALERVWKVTPSPVNVT
jgi:hypothetical protein